MGGRWLDKEGASAYREFLRGEDTVEERVIHKATSTGRPFGGLDFIERIAKVLGRDLIPENPGRKRKGE